MFEEYVTRFGAKDSWLVKKHGQELKGLYQNPGTKELSIYLLQHAEAIDDLCRYTTLSSKPLVSFDEIKVLYHGDIELLSWLLGNACIFDGHDFQGSKRHDQAYVQQMIILYQNPETRDAADYILKNDREFSSIFSHGYEYCYELMLKLIANPDTRGEVLDVIKNIDHSLKSNITKLVVKAEVNNNVAGARENRGEISVKKSEENTVSGSGATDIMQSRTKVGEAQKTNSLQR